MSEIVGYACISVGLVFILLAAIGVARLPDAFQRMHASTKAGTLGATLTVIGATLVESDIDNGTAAFTILFLLLTLPVAAQLLGRASYMSGATLTGLERGDPLAEVVDRKKLPLEERIQPPQ